MNRNDVIKVEKTNGVVTLLYSHDGGATRHAVDILPTGEHTCRLNESTCFRRGTHEHMARAHGFSLIDR